MTAPPARRRPTRRAGGTYGLLEEILANRPNLPGAACIGKHGLFDAARFPGPGTDGSTARAVATTVCRHCPVRGTCSDSMEGRR